ncbi:MAG: GGDEF domain-containing protein [Acidobacteria bacterium]|nr:GGDEF domain-containing protein [Acidobacteriota bacterium]
MILEINQMVESALSRWSILVQLGIVLVLTVLFFAAWAVTRRKVLLTWLAAWTLDTVALSAVLVIAIFAADLPGNEIFALYAFYSSAKVLFVLLLALGLFRYRRVAGSMGRGVPGWLALTALVWGILALIFCSDVVQVQAVTYGAVATILIVSGAPALRSGNARGSVVAGLVFLIHGLLFLHHLVVLIPTFWGLPIPAYMSRISFLDAVSEILVGLGCILAMGLRAVEESESANRRLEASERTLRGLVDADPLTGLFNRRRLRSFVEAAPGAGIVLFVDVDMFKAINDSWGHATGDACLLRVADALRKIVRTSDGLFRLGGDEFLVVAPGLTVPEGFGRVQRLRELLEPPDEQGIALSVSVGMAPFGDGVPLDEAMAVADTAMYQDKARRR